MHTLVIVINIGTFPFSFYILAMPHSHPREGHLLSYGIKMAVSVRMLIPSRLTRLLHPSQEVIGPRRTNQNLSPTCARSLQISPCEKKPLL